MLDPETVKVIRNVVEKQLAPARIVEVSVREDVDFDGDDVLRVDVVVEAENDRLDPKKVTGLVRHLREPLAERQETRFPMFLFFTPDEVNGATA